MKKYTLTILMAMLLVVTFAQNQISELQKGMVFHWAGSEWFPTQNLAGTENGTATATYNVPDRQGSGANRYYSFNGASDYVTLPTIPAFGTGDFSVIIKLNYISTSDYQYIIDAATNGFNLYIAPNQKLTSNKKPGTDNTVSTTSMTNGDHVVQYVRAGTSATYYIDGVNAGTITDNQDYTGLSNKLASSTYGFKGSISLVRIFNYALTPTQIANYSKPEYPIEWVDRGATGAALNTSTFADYSGTWESFYGASATGFTGISNGGDNAYATTDKDIAIITGKLYKASWTPTLTSGTSPTFNLRQNRISGTVYGSSTFTSGSVSFTATTTENICAYFVAGTSQSCEIVVANFKVQQLGCVLDLNSSGLARASDGSYNTGYWTDRTNSITATVSGATSVIPPASCLGATFFNGSTSKIVFSGIPTSVLGATDRTISMWILPFVNGAAAIIFYYGSIASYGAFYISRSSDGYLSCGNNDVNASAVSSTGTSLVAWSHVAIVFSGGNIKYYVNGAAAGTATITGTNTAVGDVYIGVYRGAGGGLSAYFNGMISNAIIYKEALDADRIKLLYDSGH